METIDLARVVDLKAMTRPANFFLDDVFARVREGAPLGPRVFTSGKASLLVDRGMARLLVEAAAALSSRGFGLKVISALRTCETQRYMRDVAADLGGEEGAERAAAQQRIETHERLDDRVCRPRRGGSR